jgi:hypothetical protein
MMLKRFYQEMIARSKKGRTSLPILAIYSYQTTHANPFVALIGSEGKSGIHNAVYVIQSTMKGHSFPVIKDVDGVLRHLLRMRIGAPDYY